MSLIVGGGSETKPARQWPRSVGRNNPIITARGRPVAVLLAIALAAMALAARAGVVFTSLHSFGIYTNGAYPQANLVRGADGDFYGTTYQGGTNGGYGTVFKITTNGVVTSLHSFAGNDGANPQAGLVLGKDGYFYGTTYYGGAYNDGTVFKITTNGVFTSLYSFAGKFSNDGAYPQAGLALGSDGDFYGTTAYGGTYDEGTVFKITTNGVLTVLHVCGIDGAFPQGGLVQGSDGNFYGTTAGGGTNNYGTVFKITPNGVFTSLYYFTGGSGGVGPGAGLVQGSDGDFYGTTESGGTHSSGTVFKISPAGVFTRLYSFTGGSDGGSPVAGLVQGSDGDFYGTTESGGTNNDNGTVFKISPAGVFTSLYSFTGLGDGSSPQAGLVQGTDGYLYGTASASVMNGGKGTVFQITTKGALTILYSFTSGSDGAGSQAGLVQGTDGYLYGTALSGGASYTGTVFKISTNGALTILYSFTGGIDGASPQAGLVQGSDGNFYGTTSGGGASGFGTIFKISASGAFTSLYSFTGGDDGAVPYAGLVQGSDGDFYGTTYQGGTNRFGTIFKISASGAFTSLYSFTGGNDGGKPYAGLALGQDGDLYGTTVNGGVNSSGTVFKISPAGVFTSLDSFAYSDGAHPYGTLTLGSDGNFYGTTEYGGTYGNGVVFTISTNGVLTGLYSFTGGSDGARPQAGLVQGSDGHFYGTTTYGGIGGAGTVFSLSVGLTPGVPIIQTTDGSFGVRTNRFGFNITGVNDSVVVVEASTNLANPIWIPVSTNILTGGASHFYDPNWANYPRRFYRIGLP